MTPALKAAYRLFCSLPKKTVLAREKPEIKRGPVSQYKEYRDREEEVIRLYDMGYSYRKIQVECGISQATVWRHLKNMGRVKGTK